MTPEQSMTREIAGKEFVFLLLVVFTFVILGSVLSLGLAPLLGIEGLPTVLANISAKTPQKTLKGIQLILGLNQLFTFLLPGLVFAIFYYKFERKIRWRPPAPKGEQAQNSPLVPIAIGRGERIFSNKKNWKERILLHRLPSGESLAWGFSLLILTFIAMQLVYWLNKQIPLPESLRAAEDSSQALIEAMMQLDSPLALPTNLLIMALLPAVGEELIFRGLLQRILVRFTADVHAGIWISATLFSLMHWQFEGFFVRQFLGALFGYMLYWSGSLWLPIIVHFVFNGLQIVAQYMYFRGTIDVDIDQNLEMTTSNLLMGAVALVLTLILCNYVHRKRKPERLEYERAMGENL